MTDSRDALVAAPSNRPSLGSTPFFGGVTFRVWAPNAQSVSVQRLIGQETRESPLARETSGNWSADVPGAAVGDEYHYTVDVAGTPARRPDPCARQVASVGGPAIVYDHSSFSWQSGLYTPPALRDLVIYELHLGSFIKGAGELTGTLADAQAKIPYLRDLGITAIELMPLGQFAGASSWGYNPGLPNAVETLYGGPDALKQFVDAAHFAEIAVLLDVVYNHVGPDGNELWAFDGPLPDAPGGIYFYGPPRDQTPWGATRPSYDTSEVAGFFLDNARMWLEDYRLDGLRLDATAYIRNVDGGADPARDIPAGWRLLQNLNDAASALHPPKIVIAEDNLGNDWITRPTDASGAGFTAQWEQGFVSTVREVLAITDDAQRDMSAIAGALLHGYSGRGLARVIYTESHDADANGGTRVPTQIDPQDPTSFWAKKRSSLGAALVLTAPGIPMLFQGQEFLETLWFSDDHYLDWSNVDTHAGIVELYRDLIRLRRNENLLTRGLGGDGIEVHHVNNAAKVIAFRRWDLGGPHDDVLVVTNFANTTYSSYTVGAPRAGAWGVRFNSDWQGYDLSFTGQTSGTAQAREASTHGLPYALDVGLGPYTAIVLSQSR
jgi:1,4-alpha-glucan branching enzyme